MSFKYFLTSFEYNEMKAKYIEEYGENVEVPSLKEFQDVYEDIHQQAFRRILPAITSEEHITFKKICDKLREFEWQALRKDYTDCVCLGIENDVRINGVAKQVERYLISVGYEIEKEEDIEKEEEKIPTREIKKEDNSLDLAKAFYKILGDYIELRNKAC